MIEKWNAPANPRVGSWWYLKSVCGTDENIVVFDIFYQSNKDCQVYLGEVMSELVAHEICDLHNVKAGFALPRSV